MQEEEKDDVEDDTWEDPDRSTRPWRQKFEPEYEDIEDQLARNEAHLFELSAAGHRLRAVSIYWYLAGGVLLAVGMFMAIPTVMVTGGLGPLAPQSIPGQTAWNSVIALSMVLAVACFIRFSTLRHLAREALDAAELNRHVVHSVRQRLERAG
ncbi:hypothetical protein ACVMIX_006641 [Rhizobium leguminosarum]